MTTVEVHRKNNWFLLVTNCCFTVSLTFYHIPDSLPQLCSTNASFLFSGENEYPTLSVSLIITVHQGLELSPENPAWYTDLIFLVFSTSNSSQHMMTIQICFEVSIFTPP